MDTKEKLVQVIEDFDGNLAYEIDNPEVYGVCGRAPDGNLYFYMPLLRLKSINFLKKLFKKLKKEETKNDNRKEI